jgi:exopolyphosphatase / guanosine-5'-triphosphate,3'-diphosphate pyrophosphatase
MKTRSLGERIGSDHTLLAGEVLGAIDVGSNAIRLKLVRLMKDGAFETLHQERDAVRPGEGIWQTGEMPARVADRLVVALGRYATICRTHGAVHIRAVATSAVREAKNKDALVERIRTEAALELEVIQGREEARLIGLGVLRGMPNTAKSLLVDIGGGSTEVARGKGEEPLELWSVPIGAVRVTDMFDTSKDVKRETLVAVRRFCQRAVLEALPQKIAQVPRHAIGSSGTIRAICAFAASPDAAFATTEQITRSVEELARMPVAARRKRFDPQRADVVIAGAVILESVLHHLAVDGVAAVDGGLKEGILVDMVQRGLVERGTRKDRAGELLAEAVLTAGRRFHFDEAHALHTRDVALQLYDQLEAQHELPPECRRLLDAAAMLHDVGYVIGRARHHKHTMYLIQNLDLPGLSDGERDVVALVARFHRRSLPDRNHVLLAAKSTVEKKVVRVLATLLRLADGADVSRSQAVGLVDVSKRGKNIHVHLHSKRGKRAEHSDSDVERALFRSVFRASLHVHAHA